VIELLWIPSFHQRYLIAGLVVAHFVHEGADQHHASHADQLKRSGVVGSEQGEV
jgi:hypothetical protein